MKKTLQTFGLIVLFTSNVHCSTLKGNASRENPSGVGQGNARVARLAEILSKVRNVAPNLVDATGSSQDRTPGLIVGIVTDEGKEVVGFGSTNITNVNLPNGDTHFGIGSVTKVFTGVILADAVQRGSIGLDDSANKYLPADLKLASEAITMRHLVTHNSGLPDFPENLRDYRDLDHDGLNDSNQYSPGRNYSRQNLADWLATKPGLKFDPGNGNLYSNLGFGLLGWALQAKMNQPDFEALNRERIAKIMQMNSTRTNTTEMRNAAQKNYAQGYFPENGSFVPVPFSDMGVLESSGELVSTTNDMLVFLEGLTGISNSPLKSAFVEANRSLASLGKDEMAYGSKITKSSKGGVYYSKTGATAGNSAIIVWRTDPRIGIVLICNRGKFNQVNELAMRIIEAAVR
ncbi:MAG: hypothetical protein RI953_793 [Pseudomonadota bacterium]|jgi:CubicO group peptidase (beta-lactamase class C family)